MRLHHFGLAMLCLVLSAPSLVAQSTLLASNNDQPINGLFPKREMQTRLHLKYPPLREADVMYQTRVERVIDSREKLNLPFRHPDRGFFVTLLSGLESGEIQLYDPAYPDFSRPLTTEEINAQLYQVDTIPIYDPVDGSSELQVVENYLNPDDVTRYRIREITYFDKRTSTQRTRILAIAPMISTMDEFGQPIFELPLGWIYWPHARAWFDHQPYYLDGTEQEVISWGDALEMRRFSSYLTKRSNVTEARLQDNYAGRDLLVKSKEAERDLANREHDLWEN